MTAPLRALVLCPGRGSYQREQLGSLRDRVATSEALAAFESERAARGRPSLEELDGAERFSPRLHLAGEHASALTAGATLADLEQLDPRRVRPVAICGNSMGWYTALAASGALPLPHVAHLVETMGGWQAADVHGVVGGQILYPTIDVDWRPVAERERQVRTVLAEVPGLHLSICLGGRAVLGGTDEALADATARLPTLTEDGRDYPLRLPLHSAFHTPLMAAAAERAARELSGLQWSSPRIPLVDGTGRTWRPLQADPAGLRDYTLGAQVTATFDFSTMVRAALLEYAPEIVLLPGPGANLGGAVAQVMIEAGWRGLRSRSDFLAAQETRPVLLSMGLPEQRARVVA